MGEIDMTATAAGNGLDRFRQRTVAPLEFRQTIVAAMAGVDIENDQGPQVTTDGAGESKTQNVRQPPPAWHL